MYSNDPDLEMSISLEQDFRFLSIHLKILFREFEDFFQVN